MQRQLAMDDQVLDILSNDIEQGTKAKKAYDLYNKDFIEDSYANIHTAFDNLVLTDTEGLQTLKMMQSAVQALEQRILLDIESKDLASKQLSAKADVDTKH